jgi:probable rRNA maturation factor
MILLDPELEADPSPRTTSAKKRAGSGLIASEKNLRLPLARSLSGFLTKAQAAVRLKGEVTVLLTTDAAIRKLNRQFRGKDTATDVLSFTAEGVGAEEIAGDLAISVATARRQAVAQGHSLSVEIKVLMLHGLLHLAGYDHEADGGKMARRERMLRDKLGLPEGLIERVGLSGAKARVDGKPAFRGLKAPAPSDSDRSVDSAQGLKPDVSVAGGAARLKSCPDTKHSSAEPRMKSLTSETRMDEVRGLPPLRQKQKRRKDMASGTVTKPSSKTRGSRS